MLTLLVTFKGAVRLHFSPLLVDLKTFLFNPSNVI